MRLAFCDCGTRDEYHLHLGLALLEQRFDELAIPHVIERFDDSHRSLAYRHEIVLPRLAGALTPAR
jgi:enterochelin esterase family protein